MALFAILGHSSGMGHAMIGSGLQRLLDRMRERRKRAGHSCFGVNHALDVLLESHAALAKTVASGLDPVTLRNEVATALAAGNVGAPLAEAALLDAVRERAGRRGSAVAYERDLAAVVLAHAGYQILDDEAFASAKEVGSRPVEARVAAGPTAGDAERPPPPGGEAPAAPSRPWRPRAKHATVALERLARDLTAEAVRGDLPPVLGRDGEIQTVLEILLRPTKRNPLLVGPAGVGKTAVVEGLARRVVRGVVPEALGGSRIFALQVADLVQGMKHVGDLEERMKQVLAEAEQDGVVVFLDEIHAAIGAGSGKAGGDDVANLLKPSLARGRIACIGATTDAEYAQFVAADSAFERRFQPLRVQELSREATIEILRARVEATGREDGIVVGEQALADAVMLAQRFLRNRLLPDKALDVLHQCVGRARAEGLREVTPEVVRDVVGRMVGVPVEHSRLTERLNRLVEALEVRAGCGPDAATQLVDRLRVTMRAMDLQPLRPNAVVLVVAAGRQAELVARVLSDELFGEESPVVDVDLSGITHAGDVSRLAGASPGYVGHDAPPPLHTALAQRPWSVVLFRRAGTAHPAAQSFLASALRHGYLTDGHGRRVYFSDAICVLAEDAPERRGSGRRVGFAPAAEPPGRGGGPGALAPGDCLEDDLASCVDVMCVLEERVAGAAGGDWIRRGLLDVAGRNWARDPGVRVVWQDALVDWLACRARDEALSRDGMARLFERDVVPAVVSELERSAGGGTVVVGVRDGRIDVAVAHVEDRDGGK